jgi:hypothetical protein
MSEPIYLSIEAAPDDPTPPMDEGNAESDVGEE